MGCKIFAHGIFTQTSWHVIPTTSTEIAVFDEA